MGVAAEGRGALATPAFPLWLDLMLQPIRSMMAPRVVAGETFVTCRRGNKQHILCTKLDKTRSSQPSWHIATPAEIKLGIHMKWFIVAIAMLMAIPALAQKPSAGDYYKGCAAVSDDMDRLQVQPEHQAAALKCLGAVSVVLFYSKENGICPPAPLTQEEAAAIVARHLDENPNDLKEPFRSVAREALSEEFPCDA